MSGIPGPFGWPGPGPTPAPIPGQGGFGTVTSVGLTLGGTLNTQQVVGNSPVTSTGNITLNWQSQTGNVVLASPPTGTSGPPTFRQLVPADMSTGPAVTAFAPTLAVATIGDGVFSGVSASGQSRQMGPLVWFWISVGFTLTWTTASGALNIAGWPLTPTAGANGWYVYAVSPTPAAPFSLMVGAINNGLLQGTIYGTGQAGNFFGPNFGLISGTAYRVWCGGVYITG